MNHFAKLPLLFSLFISTAFLAGCSSSQSGKVNHTEFCRAKYEKAEELYKKGKYGRAQDKLEDILSLCAGTLNSKKDVIVTFVPMPVRGFFENNCQNSSQIASLPENMFL